MDNKEVYINKFKEKYNSTPEWNIFQWKDHLLGFYYGYNLTDAELYGCDLTIRSYINKAINDSELDKFEEHKKFKEKIAQLDEFYMKITIERPNTSIPYGADNWYDRIFKYALQEEYFDSIKHLIDKYNLEVFPIEELSDELIKEKEKLINFDTSF